MKKQILLFACLFGFAYFATAQVGIGTDTPNATLDIVAGAGTTAPDGVLVPRISGDDLQANDAEYGMDQDGAMIFATSAPAAPSAKTANITGKGFYYYDGDSEEWVGMGGSAAAPKNKLTIVTDNSYTIAADDDIIVTKAPAGGVQITLPVLTAADAGRIVFIHNSNLTAQANHLVGDYVGVSVMNQMRGYGMAWDGSIWVLLTK